MNSYSGVKCKIYITELVLHLTVQQNASNAAAADQRVTTERDLMLTVRVM